MTKKLASVPTPAPLPASPSTNPAAAALETRDRLRAFLKNTRLSLMPKVTQLGLSERLRFPYSIVTAWENGTRAIYQNQLLAWAEAVGLDKGEQDELLAAHAGGYLSDKTAGISTGSRMDEAVNTRLKQLRKHLRFSLREMADVSGISTGHLQRVEQNKGNLSVAQLREVHQKLRISYGWLIDGKGEMSEETLQDKVTRLERENALLEALRKAESNQR